MTLQLGTQPVEQSTYRTNTRAELVVSNCVNQMQWTGHIYQYPTPLGSSIDRRKYTKPPVPSNYAATVKRTILSANHGQSRCDR